MKSLSTVVLVLLIRFAPGLTEESNFGFASEEDLRYSSCQIFAEVCGAELQKIDGEDEECLEDVCSHLFRLCQKKASCRAILFNCRDALPNCIEKLTRASSKRSSTTKNSFLFMKLHPLLNRAIDPALINLPSRFRRIGGRFGSEFLGKRSNREIGEVDAGTERRSGISGGEIRRGRRLPGTELLGKRIYGSEMLGKRNIEMLGKRGVEFLGKRSTEFLGKRMVGECGNAECGIAYGSVQPADAEDGPRRL